MSFPREKILHASFVDFSLQYGCLFFPTKPLSLSRNELLNGEKMGEEDVLDMLFSALAHEARRKVILELGKREEMTFTEMMEVSGIEETGTFGFHLKKIEPLLEKGDFGKYRLSELGKLAYNILSYVEEGHLPEKKEVVGEPRVIKGIDELVVTKELLKEGPVVIQDCDTVVFDSDVDAELFKRNVLSLRNIDVIEVPKHLYKLVFSKIEENVDMVTYYEGEWKPERSQSFVSFSEMIIDLPKIEDKVSIVNFGKLKLEGLNDENLEKIESITNFGTVLVPKGFREKIFRKMTINSGIIEEYDEEEEKES